MKIQQTTLENGLRIVTAHLTDARSLTANILVGTGSRYEDFNANGGVSHFLEHLLFKGTKKYPSAQAIAEAVDAVGGYNNAYTSEDLTSYYIKVPDRYSELALDILSDMIRNPLIETDEVNRERGVIIEEMNVWRDDPARFIGTLLPDLVFPDNPLGQDIIGSEDVINKIPVDDIRAYQALHYRPNNIVIAVAGNIVHKNVVEQMERTLGDLSPVELQKPEAVGPALAKDVAITENKATAQAHFMVGARAYPYDHPDDRASKVLAAILGRGMSSRLFTNVRERQGLAYTIYAEINNYTDTGLFHIYAGVNLDKIPQAISSVLRELEVIRHEVVSEAELNKAKQQLRAGLEMSLESNGSVADRIGTQLLLTGKVKPIEDTISEIEAVSIEDVQRVAKALLEPGSLRFAIIAPNPQEAAEHFRELTTKQEQI